MVTALHRKLVRDLWRLRGQALTIALVMACGIASYVALYSTYQSLEGGRDRYYERNRFADVFAHVKRAPEATVSRLERIPGVALVHSRLVEKVTLPLEDSPEPAVGRIVGERFATPLPLNVPHLKKGRLPEAGHADEVVVIESFATAHHLEPGDRIPAIIDGVWRQLGVVGIALSPEYIFAVPDFDPLPDPARFAVLWMERDLVASAYQMEGAFDDVVLRLQPGAQQRAVLDAVDRILEPYGGTGAIGRELQFSNRFLIAELEQLGQLATVVASIFLGVAAFLLNVVISRLLHLQRAQIATMKAVGYRDIEVGAHYLELVTTIAFAGAVTGTVGGALLGRGMMRLYEPYFRYPDYGYQLDAGIAATAILLSFGAALAGAAQALYRAVRVPPAEAMRPEAPPSYKASLLERIGIGRLLDPSGRMVLRELTRRPLRTSLSVLGIAFATAILIASRFTYDAVDAMMSLEFETGQRQDLTVAFTHPISDSGRRDLSRWPGVLGTEPIRTAAVRLRAGARKREVALTGLLPDSRLQRVVEWPGHQIPMPERGVVLTDKLAEILGVGVGDTVSVEELGGDTREREIAVADLAGEMFGLQAHMSLAALHALLDEDDVISAVLLAVDPRHLTELERRLKDMPTVGSVTRRLAAIDRFRKQTAETMNVTTLVLVLFAGTIAVGIVYNNARIALSLRSRDLASLRVLGFTRAEISSVLLGELATYVLLSIPVGLAIGTWLAHLVGGMADPEAYRFPVTISGRTYAFAVVVTLGAALLSALLVRRKLDTLDLIGVLKTRE